MTHWIALGGAFSSLRSVVLDYVVEPEIGVFYRKIKKPDSNRLRLPKGISRRSLNYMSFNENASLLKKNSFNFDLQVQSEVDFAMLCGQS